MNDEQKYNYISERVNEYKPKIPRHLEYDDLINDVWLKISKYDIDWNDVHVRGYIRTAIYCCSMTMWRKQKKKRFDYYSEMKDIGYYDSAIEDFEI